MIKYYDKPIIHTMPQGTDEWRAVKCGKISASSMADVLASRRNGGESKTRKTYMLRLLAERLSGIPQETYQNGAMQWGVENEPFARQAYEMDKLLYSTQIGFYQTSDFTGCSPDGLIDDDGLIEIKCPYTSTHLQYILDNKAPCEYYAQVQAQMWITGRQWCDFVSYDPRVLVRPYWCIRVPRDEDKIRAIEIEVEVFIDELTRLEKKIKGE